MAIIKEIGTISVLGEVQSGTSQQGNPWCRQTIVVDVAGYNGSYRKVALQATGDVVRDLAGAVLGEKIEVSYQVTAREWNGKWYNNVDLYKVEFLDIPQQPVAPAYPQQQMPQVNPQMYPQTAPAAPAAPAPRGRRGASTPQIPAGTPMDLQEDDLPPSFYQ